MKISVKSDYALHAIFDLAMHSSNEPVKIADIARRQNIPQKFLELILSNLKQGGFVESRRGADGGYRLSKPASRLTVGEVLRYVEGRQTERGRPRQDGASPFGEMWKQVDQSAAAVLDNMTFEALVRKWEESRNRFVPNWEI